MDFLRLFFRKRFRDTVVLPKEIVVEILSRLPPISVIRFRLVCKEWRLLTSTQSFIEMHENHKPATPLESTFVIQYFDRKITIPRFQFKTLLINLGYRQFEMVRDDIDINRGRESEQYYLVDLLSSYKGFFLFSAHSSWPGNEESALIFYNPVTKEQVSVTAPPNTNYFYCAFFFHLPTKEYRILYQVFDDDDDNKTRFEIFSLQTRTLRKIYEKYHPDLSTPAVISNGALHWMVSEDVVPNCSKTILTFGIESEKFNLMPHPRFYGGVHDCVSLGRSDGHQMNVFEMEGGVLCLCDFYNYLELNIFVMDKYENWRWVRAHVIPMDFYPGIKAMEIHHGELLLYHKLEEKYLLYPLKEEGAEPSMWFSSPRSAGAEVEEPSMWFSSPRSAGTLRGRFLCSTLECDDDNNLIFVHDMKMKLKTRFNLMIDQFIRKKNDFLNDDHFFKSISIEHPSKQPESEHEYGVPSTSLGNIVVFTPTIASLNTNGNYILSLPAV